ncbi:hypothetical protein FRC03_011804 [Tulasnella sp. 419]|nr:hypothetical protein FRC03_011804 [Tulasnella sp. 419]
MQRELRFPHSWYSWFQSFQPDTLLLDLHTLSSHSDSYISTTAKAISSLLYPSTSPLENYSVWPIHCGNSVGNAEFFTYHRVLIEVRLVTMRFIQESRQKNDSKVSRRRHLFCYYDDLMNNWISGLASDGVMDIAQNGKIFEAAMVLGYLILEDHHDISRVLDSGESTAMKAARCLMALTRWLDRGTTDGQKISAMDTKLRDSFALSVISSTTRYLQLAAGTVNPRKLGQFKRMEDDENTVFVGMKHLEVPLLKLAAQESHITFLRDQAISALEAFYAIPGHADFRLFPWELPSNLTSLIDQLKSRALTSDTTIKRVSALRAATKVLNLISEPLVARSLALDASPSLTEVIGCMAQEESVDIRIAALTAFLETPSLHPPISEPRETRVVGSDKPTQPSLSSDQVHIDVQYTPDTRLLTSYSNALKDHSSLLQALEDTRDSSSEEFIRKCVSFIDMLEKSLPREILPSPMIEMPKYPTALVLIASHEDEELVDASIRKLALELYARLCQSAEEKDLGRITKAVTWLIVHRVNMGLECISLLMDGLEQSTTYAELFGLAEVLKKAVVCADFGRGDLEEKCQELYDRLEEILHQEH